MVIPPQPEHVSSIDPTGPFFTLQNGENITKVDINVSGNTNQRLLGFTSEKIMTAGIRMAKDGVMDATFKVIILYI